MLQEELGAAGWVLVEDPRDAVGDPIESVGLRAGRVRTGVEHNAGQAECVRPLELVDEGTLGTAPQRGVGRGQIDEIAGMGDVGSDAGLVDPLTKPINFIDREGTRAPLS